MWFLSAREMNNFMNIQNSNVYQFKKIYISVQDTDGIDNRNIKLSKGLI